MTDIDFTRRIETVTIPVGKVQVIGNDVILENLSGSAFFVIEKSQILSVTYAKEKVKRGDRFWHRGEEWEFKGFLGDLLIIQSVRDGRVTDGTPSANNNVYTRNGEILTIEDFE